MTAIIHAMKSISELLRQSMKPLKILHMRNTHYLGIRDILNLRYRPHLTMMIQFFGLSAKLHLYITETFQDEMVYIN